VSGRPAGPERDGRGRAGLVVAALALGGVLVLALFPVRAYLAQRHHREELASQVATLEAANMALEDRAATLRSEAEIERLARRYNLVRPGEELYFIPPSAAPPAVATTAAPAPPPSQPWWSRAWAKVTAVL
jgi:cell division protein FtsB